MGHDRQTSDDPPRITVVIPHLNQVDELRRCLESVRTQSLDSGAAEIIVVDNGSHVDLASLAESYPDIRFLVEPRPGPGLARNLGAAAARSRLLAFVDADCIVADNWLQAAVDVLDRSPKRGLVGGDIRIPLQHPPGASPIEAYESVFSFRQKLYIETKQFSVTANLAMVRGVYDLVGPFRGIDVAEDRDWGRRASALRVAVSYEPKMIVYHPARPDFPSLTRKWSRLISHDFTEWSAAARPLWRWYVRALLMLGSTVLHAGRMFTSDRVSGMGSRFSGLVVLARLRIFRFCEMIRVARSPGSGAVAWNRNS